MQEDAEPTCEQRWSLIDRLVDLIAEQQTLGRLHSGQTSKYIEDITHCLRDATPRKGFTLDFTALACRDHHLTVFTRLLKSATFAPPSLFHLPYLHICEIKSINSC